MPARKGGPGGKTVGKQRALADPKVQAFSKMVPVLPEDSDYRLMTLDQIAEHINQLDGTIRKINAFTMAVQNIALGVDIKNVEDMRNRFYTYCALAERCEMRLGNLNAYHSMGINMQTAYAWKNGLGGYTAERKQLIDEVNAVCSGSREMLASMQQINPVLSIFWQKNFDGFRDVQEHIVAPGDPLGDKQTPEQIAEKYQDIIEE